MTTSVNVKVLGWTLDGRHAVTHRKAEATYLGDRGERTSVVVTVALVTLTPKRAEKVLCRAKREAGCPEDLAGVRRARYGALRGLTLFDPEASGSSDAEDSKGHVAKAVRSDGQLTFTLSRGSAVLPLGVVKAEVPGRDGFAVVDAPLKVKVYPKHRVAVVTCHESDTESRGAMGSTDATHEIPFHVVVAPASRPAP